MIINGENMEMNLIMINNQTIEFDDNTIFSLDTDWLVGHVACNVRTTEQENLNGYEDYDEMEMN